MPERLYMQRCLDLALQGFPAVLPNPMVGAVIICNDQVTGEGWHKKFGKEHAEVNAISSVHEKSSLKNSTLYINLEPCSHHGKTPPCTDLIIRSGIPKVIIATKDPNPVVTGKGIQQLKEAGIEVVNGILEKEACELNKRFFTFHKKKRPYIILKWAQTKDGFIAQKNGASKWISTKESRMLVHKWRTEEMGIMTGTNTVKTDNPYLTARLWPGRNPSRIIMDKKLSLPNHLNVFHPDAQVYIFNEIKDLEDSHLHYIKIAFDDILIARILEHLFQRDIQSILVEGGCRLINSFISSGLWDEARIFISKKEFGEGIPAPIIHGTLTGKEISGEDDLHVYTNL
jgi:diaminohydroxyphosphoribosylaminopyrimidine deaminase / 5-amino-6-(5-phosphoribosylamino)uracil reductase